MLLKQIREDVVMVFTINNIGYDYKENKNFKIDRPIGLDDYLFIFFSSEVYIKIDDKITTAKPDSCIIFSPKYPQLYFNEKTGFNNDWFHFTGDSVDSFFQLLGIPLNSLFQVNNYSFIRMFIKNIEMEYIRKDLFWEQSISALMMSSFVLLAREIHYHNTYIINPYKTDMMEKFKVARFEILTKSDYPWNIEEMSALLKLSRSRFTVLYKEFFLCSPKEELIRERIKKAQYLLSLGNMAVNAVAYKVGYDNIYHFNRQFKKITGCSPGKYFNKH